MVFILGKKNVTHTAILLYLWTLKCRFHLGACGKSFHGMNAKLSVTGDCD